MTAPPPPPPGDPFRFRPSAPGRSALDLSGFDLSVAETSGVDDSAVDPSPLDSGALLEPLVPLFAPYCGGVTQQLLLESAVRQLLMGEWQGERRLQGDAVRLFSLRWHGEPAPLETLRCELTFPDLPAVHYEFTLPAYRLVLWLMQRQEGQLPVSFWSWLLLGELPRSGNAGPAVGDGAADA